MKRLITVSLLGLGLLTSGCISYESYSMKVDLVSGTLDLNYRNLASQGTKEDSAESDWKSLKGMLKGDKEKKNGLADVHSRLFEEAGVLSGSMTCRFAKSDAPLEARLAVLDKELDGEASLRLVDGMIVLLSKEDKEVLSSNGKAVKISDKQVMLVWPADAKTLEVSFRGNSTKSLLPYYLKEQK